MDNKLEKYLNREELQYFFETPVTEDEKLFKSNIFFIDTTTHRIIIKNPKITWEKPYTEPDKTCIKCVEANSIYEAQGIIKDTKTELCFSGETSIEGFPDLDLTTSVLLDIEKIPINDLLKINELSREVKYHLYDFGTGEDIDVTNPDTHLSGKDWRNIFAQGVPTINTENPIILTAEIEVISKNVEKTIEFPILETNVTMTVEIDSTSTYGLVTITMSSLDKSSEKLILSIDALNKSKQLHIDIATDDYETVDIYRNLT